MNDPIPNNSPVASQNADAGLRKLAPIAIVAVFSVLIGAGAVGVSSRLSTIGHLPSSTESSVAALSDESKSALIAAFADKQGLEVKGTFPSAERGLTIVSYIEKQSGRAGIFYSMPNGNFLAGQVYSKEGDLTSKADFAMAWPDGAPDATPKVDMAAVEKSLKSAAMLTEAKPGAPEIYMVYEPHCGYCQRSHEILKNMNVTIHYLPVAFLAPDSEALVAATLSGEPDVINRLNNPHERDALSAKYASKAAAIRPKIEANTELMHLAGISGTPGFIWVDKTGVAGIQRGYLDEAAWGDLLKKISADQGVAVAAAPAVAKS